VNFWKKTGSLLFLIPLVSGIALADSSVVGVWKGRVRFNRATLPNLPNPRSNTLRLKQLDQVERVEITLTLLSNHTYLLKTTGEKQPKSPMGGRWSSTSKTLSLQRVVDGKEHGLPQVYNVEPDFKHMGISKKAGGMDTTVSFTKQ